MSFTKRQKLEIAIIAALVTFFILLGVKCNKDEIVHPGPSNEATEVLEASYITTHGNEIGLVIPAVPTEKFVDKGMINKEELNLPAFVLIQPYPSTRSIYLDKADTIYNNPSGRAVFAKYCKDNKFDEVHFYRFSNITSNATNFPNLATFVQLLQQNGVNKRIAVLGSSSTTYFQNFRNYTSDTTKRFNGINLELEWWNSVTSYSSWINTLTTLDSYCDSKSPDLYNSFYMGWYNNMGGVTDSAAARQQLQEVDWIDLHCYRANKLDYAYTKTRLEAIAKAAKSLGKLAHVNIIVSTEQTAWGAANNFDGYYLQLKGYAGLEKIYIDDFNTNASSNVKNWVRIDKFKYFTKRYNYKAIPPK